jgi:hypothetical protein
LKSRMVAIVLGVGLLFSALLLASRAASFRLPGNHQGYEPVQPIAYSHRLHAGELQIDCMYCHGGAETSRHAGIPAANVCMNCHQFVTATLGAIREEDDLAAVEKRAPRRIVSPELQKLFDSVQARQPVAWTKVHNLPDYVYFDHRAHVGAGVTCQTCHGPVETMERVRQVNSLSMGWCVDCHRTSSSTGIEGKKVAASLDCAVCHY